MNKSKPESLENACVSVNRAKGIYGFFTVLGILPVVIGQRHFQNRGLFAGKQTTPFIPTKILAS